MKFPPYPSRHELGLPENAQIERVLYEEKSQTIVAALLVDAELCAVGRLFYRKQSARRYRPVTPTSANASTTSAVVGGAGQLCFLSTTFARLPDGTIGGDEPEVGVVDLSTGRTRYIRAVTADESRSSVATLAGVSRSGRHIYCSVGYAEKRYHGLVYRFSRLAISTGVLSPLARMPGVFV